MELTGLHRDKRDSLVYDPQIKGYDNTFFANVTGTPTATGGKIRFNAATAASYTLFEFPAMTNFKITVPAAPTSGDSRRFGFFAPADQTIGAIYFDITDTAFTVHVTDSAGTDQSKTVTWQSGWTNAAKVYGIAWEPDRIQFWVDGTIVATFGIIAQNTIPQFALPLYIKNGNADNMDVSSIEARSFAGIV